MMENTTIRGDLNNTWTTEIFTQHAVDTIARFSPASDARLFLYLAFQNVHWPLMAPQAYVDRFAHTTGNNTARQLVCAMAAFLDDGVANVTAALKRAGSYEDTLIVFSSDNGGPTHGDEGTQSNNYPLRGGKNTLFEGGTRVVGLVAGAGVVKTGYTLHEKVHATDWLPSLVSMATGGQDFRKFAPAGEPPYLLGDGIDVWDTLSTGAPSPRDWLLLETHPTAHTVHESADAPPGRLFSRPLLQPTPLLPVSTRWVRMGMRCGKQRRSPPHPPRRKRSSGRHHPGPCHQSSRCYQSASCHLLAVVRLQPAAHCHSW